DDVNTFTVDNDRFTEQKAIDKGLLEKADANAKSTIENVLKSNKVISENYDVVIKGANDTEETTAD
ncbi:MAG: hypothetical protein ACI4PX_00185, partial [Ruminococcus sp.]